MFKRSDKTPEIMQMNSKELQSTLFELGLRHSKPPQKDISKKYGNDSSELN